MGNPVPEHPIIKSLVDQLAHNSKALEALEPLQREREFLEKSLADARKFYSAQTAPAAKPREPDFRTPTARIDAKSWRRAPDGPKETVIRIVEQSPGIIPGEARKRARETAVTVAVDKARSVEEALRRAIDEGIIVERNGGLYKANGTPR